jgi:hypothetical protein
LALKVKDAASAARKFVQRGQAAAQDYAAGVAGASADWQQKTAASADTYNQGVQDAIARGAFARGINSSSATKYQTRASGVGAQRFPQGIAQAGPDWEQATAPFLQTLSSLTLSPRRPKGDPGNITRVAEVNQALRRRKVGGQ